MTTLQIKYLNDKYGAQRWTKYDRDRLYFKPENVGLYVDYYKTGNVSYAEWDGKTISNYKASHLLSGKYYIDLKDDSIHDTCGFLESEWITDRIEALMQEAREKYPETKGGEENG